jgi:hypothetical protein
MSGHIRARTQFYPKNLRTIGDLLNSIFREVRAFALYEDRIEYVCIDVWFRKKVETFPFNDITFCVTQNLNVNTVGIRRKSTGSYGIIGFNTQVLNEQLDFNSWYLFLCDKVPSKDHVPTIIGDNNTYISGNNNILT